MIHSESGFAETLTSSCLRNNFSLKVQFHPNFKYFDFAHLFRLRNNQSFPHLALIFLKTVFSILYCVYQNFKSLPLLCTNSDHRM